MSVYVLSFYVALNVTFLFYCVDKVRGVSLLLRPSTKAGGFDQRKFKITHKKTLVASQCGPLPPTAPHCILEGKGQAWLQLREPQVLRDSFHVRCVFDGRSERWGVVGTRLWNHFVCENEVWKLKTEIAQFFLVTLFVELINFKRKKVAAFRKNPSEMSELEIKHARVSLIFTQESALEGVFQINFQFTIPVSSCS